MNTPETDRVPYHVRRLRERVARFTDLPDAERFAHRQAIEAAGGLVAAYQPSGFQTALPNPPEPFLETMRARGLRPVPEGSHYFPIGSDHAPEHLRHDAHYAGSRGFWRYATLAPAPAPEPDADA